MQHTIYLFDSQESHENLLPLSFTRPVADFRVGITTIREKWEAALPARYEYFPVDYLREKFGQGPASGQEAIFISGSIIPTPEFLDDLACLSPGEALTDGEETVAFIGKTEDLSTKKFIARPLSTPPRRIRYVFDIFLINPTQIADDFFRLTSSRQSEPLDSSNTVIGPYTDSLGRPLIFIEKGASVCGATLNLKNGPIYIGKDAEVMEGSCLRGPIALCENGIVRMGSKIYGGSTFGPYCKIGGEIDNSIMFGYSNKAHDGYLGNAVIGEWCNIGAGVNASNLKNDYSKIRVWNYHRHTFMRTDLQFCGLIMGDHSKIGVNCMLNTATVIGVGVNLHGAGFPRVFIPSFSEGSPTSGFTNVAMKKFHEIAERAMCRRDLRLNEDDRRIYEKVYEVASKFKG